MHVRVALGWFYDTAYFAIALLTGLFFFALGIAVLVRRPDDEPALVFHWVMMAAASLVLTSPGRYTPILALGITLRFMYSVSFTALGALLLHFTLVFPRRTNAYVNRILGVLYILGGIASAVLATTFVYAVLDGTSRSAARYTNAYDVVDLYFVCTAALSLLVFINTYRTASLADRRTKLRWVFAGFLAGPLVVVLLFFAPKLVIGISVLSESWMLVFAGLSAVLFAVAIVRHHVLDVEFLVTRGTVYGLVLALLAVLYTTVVAVLAAAVGTTDTGSSVPPVVAAVLVVLLFTPVRARVQHFVDKRFFRVKYDFRKAQRSFVSDIMRGLDVGTIATLVVNRTDELIPVERIGFFSMTPSGAGLRLEAHHGFDLLERHAVAFSPEQISANLMLPVAREGTVEAGVEVGYGEPAVMDRWGMAVVFPMLSEREAILGFVVVGRKRSGARFSAEDIDLMRTVAVQAGLSVDRVRLQEQLLVQRAESQRLEELNALKSYFVSSVSHELKTPLTSIRMFAEILETAPDLPREKVTEYLGIIEGESSRLARLIDSVLDFAKIERGTKEYHFSEVRVNEVVDYVMRTMAYQFQMNKCAVETHLDSRIGTIHADPDALAEALINLLSNAIKYSHENKYVGVETTVVDNHVAVIVRDHGIGMSEEDRARAFDAFFRSGNTAARRAGGTGLGLTLVRHIMDAHNGRVTLDSTPGEGSTVTLYFPVG